MKFVICDDSKVDSDLIGAILEPIKLTFPGSQIVIVDTFDAALTAANQYPAPDCVVMDYIGLLDGENRTKLVEIEARSPVIIVTNHDPDYVEKQIGRPVKILSKGSIINNHGLLYRGMVWVMERFEDKKHAAHGELMKRLRNSVVRDGATSST